MSILAQRITQVWRCDMAEAREAFAAGDRMMGFINLRRAAIARRWISEDLRGRRAYLERRAADAEREARRAKLRKRIARLTLTHQLRVEAIQDLIRSI
jgi:hypothetical protein